MTYSLEKLLEVTGVDDLAGTPFTKKAAQEPVDFLKLAAECREAADSEDDAPVQQDLIDGQALVEKTAAVAIIRQTIAEIHQIAGTPPEHVKTASQQGPDEAAFIKSALEQGHTPEEIARFLEETRDGAPAQKKKVATSIIG